MIVKYKSLINKLIKKLSNSLAAQLVHPRSCSLRFVVWRNVAASSERTFPFFLFCQAPRFFPTTLQENPQTG
jgi:hypothetical protein